MERKQGFSLIAWSRTFLEPTKNPKDGLLCCSHTKKHKPMVLIFVCVWYVNHFLKIYSVKINSPLLHKCSALLTSHTSYLMLFDTKHERLQNSFVKLEDDLLPPNGKTCFAFVNTSGKRSVCEKLLKVCSRLLQAQKWLLINLDTFIAKSC